MWSLSWRGRWRRRRLLLNEARDTASYVVEQAKIQSVTLLLTKIQQLGALGTIESFSVAVLIEGPDAMAKTVNIKLTEVRLAMALGGEGIRDLDGNRGCGDTGWE